ncbi:MAG: DUF5989 family protein [Candidatus Omnitrophota bacterium]
MKDSFKELARRYRPLWLIPLLILLIIITVVVISSIGKIHTPFIYSTF